MLEVQNHYTHFSGSRIGIDLGGTNMNVGCIDQGALVSQCRYDYNAQAKREVIIDLLCQNIESHWQANTQSIGIGVPSVVDESTGVVYEVANIPSWQQVPLKTILEKRFNVPVSVNNDVNCFVLGEHRFGAAKGVNNVVGICLGTGLGVGLIINGQLYSGNTCGAGELGEMPYRDGILEDYCSGAFFQNFHHCSGQQVFQQAQAGEPEAVNIFHDFGEHVAQAISTALLAYDPQMIVLGGSVAQALALFNASMQKKLQGFAFQTLLKRCQITAGQQSHAAIWGAASL